MTDTYAEAGVKREKTAGSYAIKGGMIALIVLVFVVGTAIIPTIAPLLAIAIGIGCFFLFPRLNVEYEYVYCDGQIDFDKIMGNQKRKTALRIELENAEIIAPANSHAIDSYNHSNNITVKDFSSGKQTEHAYAIIYRKGEQNMKILFEPSEKMLNCIRLKYPRKLSQI